MIKVLSIFGTRPEAVKMAPVIRSLAARPGQICSRVCVTAQHRQMLDQVLHLFQIACDYDLNVMQDSQTPTSVAAAVLANLEPVLAVERPDWVLVHGDTTTAMAAAVAANYQQVRVGHVEAGLRTYDKRRPFPEEINRRVVSAVSDLHFAPTWQSRQNLLSEGVPDENILITGNPVIDALQWASAQPFDFQTLNIPPGYERLVLVTAHRRENFGAPFEAICLALSEIAGHYGSQVRIVYPVHPNPNVQQPAYRLLADVENITLLPPLDYLPMVNLVKHADLVLTDSGGLQEEAPGLGKPVLVMRETTERPEAVQAGTVRLVGTERGKIVAETRRLLDDPLAYRQMARAVNPYGDGQASSRIVAALLEEPLPPFESPSL